MQKVFDTGEILSLILGLLDRDSCARLITTSQNFFNQGTPHIWRNLHTPEPLLLLIPGTKQVVKQDDQVYIELPPLSADFSRFDLYARFVQTLDIFGPDKKWITGHWFRFDASWQTLKFRAQQFTLLPNLRELKLDKTFETDDDPILWLTAFLSPSIKTFKAERALPYSDPASSVTSAVLRLVTQNCPDVENVTLYLGPPGRAVSLNSSPFHILMGAPISRTWLNAQNLRSLVTDVYALDANSLLALGQLPHLSSLEIRRPAHNYSTGISGERLPTCVRTMALSDNSFPSLWRLAVDEIHNDDILLLWDFKPLIRNLNRVELVVQLAPGHFVRAERIKHDPFLTPFLSAMCAGSPQLTDLVINNPSRTSGRGILHLHIDHFECLSSLPLQRVEIMGIHIYGPDELSFPQRVSTFWPMAIDLNLPHQWVHPTKLHYFAMIPNLRRLVLNCWDKWREYKLPRPTSVDHPLHTLEFGQDIKDKFQAIPTDEFARYLLSFWPNLQRVVATKSGSSTWMKSLNQAIRMSQGISEAKRRIASKYGAQEVSNLLPKELMGFLLR